MSPRIRFAILSFAFLLWLRISVKNWFLLSKSVFDARIKVILEFNILRGIYQNGYLLSLCNFVIIS
jgi:hypothetical protein